MTKAENLMAAQMKLMHAMVKTRSRFSITPGESHILGYLSQTPSKVAPLEVFRKMLEVNASTMTAMTKRMVEKGLITMERDASNRRQQLLTITSTGEAAFTKVMEEWKCLCQVVIDQLGEAQTDQLIQSTNEIARIFLESEEKQ